MTEREALKLALDALLEVKSWKSPTRWDGCFDKEITAIKKALAQPEQEPEPMALEKTVCPFCSSEWVTAEQHDRKMDRLEQEPVAWAENDGEGNVLWDRESCFSDDPEWLDNPMPLYTTPPQRLPLTDEEIILIVAECASSHQHTDIHFARAIERAHGIKENK